MTNHHHQSPPSGRVAARALVLVAMCAVAAVTAALAGDAADGAGAARAADSGPGLWTEQTITRTLVFSGATTLMLSVTGIILVLRRRRYW